MNDDNTELKLVERLRSGDKSACAECVETYSEPIYRLALRLLGNEAEAEDVVQETFLSAFKSIDNFEWRSQLNTWLYRIAYNTAMMRLRRSGRESDLAVDDLMQEEQPGALVPRQFFDWCCLPERDFETEEAHGELERAIHELPVKLRAVFLLRELEGLSTEETAQTLGITAENVKTRLHRARLWLRERLADYFTEVAGSREEGL